MKRILLLLMLLCSLGAWAQDVIVKKDGSTVVCRVVEVTKTEVVYKKWTDLQGSSYIIDKSLVSVINYENGTKQDLENTADIAESIKPMTDSDLLKMAGFEGVNKTKTFAERKITRLKRIGWIGGSVIAVAGIASCIGICSTGEDATRAAGISLGAGGLLIGAALTPVCLVRAHKIRKQMLQSQYSVHSAPLYHQEFKLKNGASLATGIDFIGDNTNRHPAIGIGLNYNF